LLDEIRGPMLIADVLYGYDPDAKLREILLSKLPRYLKSLVDISTCCLLRPYGFDLDSIFESEQSMHDGKRVLRSVSFGDTTVYILEK